MSRIIVIFLAAMVATALTAPIDGRLAGPMSEVKEQATVKATCSARNDACDSDADCCAGLSCRLEFLFPGQFQNACVTY